MMLSSPFGFNTLSLTQASRLRLPVTLSAGASGTDTKSSNPSRLNACPTLPAPNVAPFCSVPGFDPAISFAVVPLPLPSHQLTIPVGGEVQGRHLPAKLAL